MASKRRSGKSIGEILADQQILRETGGVSSLFEATGQTSGLTTNTSSRDRGYNLFDPAEGPPKPSGRRKPGLGGAGRQRINESLTGAPFTISTLPESGDELPPEEPPEDSDEGLRELPPPEYIGPISQSTNRPGYGSKRPDKDPAFWGSGPDTSTRVHAIQWIPVFRDGAYVVGDIIVAFARPSSKQSASGAGSLYLYGDKKLETWNTFKSSNSLGRSVNVILGTGTPFNTENISFYERIHPDHSTWIFSTMGTWKAIRNPNEIDGGTRTAGRAAREEEALDILKGLF